MRAAKSLRHTIDVLQSVNPLPQTRSRVVRTFTLEFKHYMKSIESNVLTTRSSYAVVWRRWIGRAVFALMAIMFLYLGATIWSVRGDLFRALGRLPLSSLPSAIGLVLCGLALRAGRWHYYARRLRWVVPAHHSVMAFLASFAFTATPGKAGELVKSVLLRTRYDIPLADGAGVLLVERLGDLLAVIILAAGGLALLPGALGYLLVTALLVGVAMIFVCNRPIYAPFFSRLAKVPKLSGTAHKILRMLDSGRVLLQPAPFLVGVGIAVLAWGCEGWAFHIIIQGFGVESRLLTACSIFGVATLVGALSALPGGLGSFEGIMVLLLSQTGMSVGAATLPVVVFRFCTLWLGSLIGLVFMVGWLSFVSPVNARSPSGDSDDQSPRLACSSSSA
jgi:uncharacterized protein (TIRG00374 family)